MYRLIFAALLAALMSFAQAAGEVDPVYQTEAEFRAVVDTVKEANEKIGKIKKGLRDAKKRLISFPKSPQRDRLLKELAKAERSLGKHARNFKAFGKYAGHVTSAFDMANTLNGLNQAASAREGGPLAKQLHLISTGMEQFGGKVPILGPAIEAYGKAAGSLLNATDKVSKTLQKERNQGQIGAGTYGLYSAKYQALKKQYGRDFADGDTYAPEGPAFVYKSINDPNVTLIWDQAAGEWYRSSNPKADIGRLYRDSLYIGKPRSPFELKVLGDNYDKILEREKAADELFAKLQRQEWTLAFANADENSKGALRRLLADPLAFRAYYAHDQLAHGQIDQLVEGLKAEQKRLNEEEARNKAAEKRAEKKKKKARQDKEKKGAKEKQKEEGKQAPPEVDTDPGKSDPPLAIENRESEPSAPVAARSPEKKPAPKQVDPQKRKNIEAQIAAQTEDIASNEERITAIKEQIEEGIGNIQKRIETLRKALKDQRIKGNDFIKEMNKRKSATKDADAKATYRKKIADCKRYLGDKTFVNATWGGYYGTDCFSSDNPKTGYWGRPMFANLDEIKELKKRIQEIRKRIASGEISGVNPGLGIEVGSYYYPVTIAELRGNIEAHREAIQALRKELK